MSINQVESEQTLLLKSQDDIASWLVANIAHGAGVDPDEIDPDKPFQEYQLDSSVTATLTMKLSLLVGMDLPITLFWEHPTINKLSAALSTMEKVT